MGIGVIVVCLAVAIVLLGWGVRGRFVEAAWCRACRSDLRPGPETVECPHCGVALKGDSAVGFGHRRPRPMAIGLAVLFAWVGISIAAVRLSDRLKAVEWEAYKPTGVLLSEAQSAHPDKALSAIDELLRRENAGDLSSERRDVLVDLLLTKVMPGGWRTTSPWVPLVEQAWLDGRLDEKQTLDFVKHLVSLSCWLPGRREIRQGTFLRFSLFPAAPVRLTGHALEVSTLPLDVTFAGGPVRAEFESSGQATLIQPGLTVGGGGRIRIPIVEPPGVHALRSTWRIDVQISGQPETAVSWTEAFVQEVIVEPSNSESVEILVDEESSQVLRRSMLIDLVGVRGLHPETGADVIVGVVDCQPAPMQVKADFEVRLGQESVQFVEQRYLLLVCVPLQEGEEDKPLRIFMRSTPIEIIDMPGRRRDERPAWYGPDIAIECGSIKWFDSIEDERIPETIRKRLWKRMISQLAPRPGATVDP